MSQAGREIVWCNEAVVLERLEVDRMRLGWIYMRAYRVGQSHTRIYYLEGGGAKINSVPYLVSTFFLLILSICRVLIGVVINRRFMLKHSCKAFERIGRITAFLNTFYVEYKDVEY